MVFDRRHRRMEVGIGRLVSLSHWPELTRSHVLLPSLSFKASPHQMSKSSYIRHKQRVVPRHWASESMTLAPISSEQADAARRSEH
jgi:hypothetical protein